MSVFRILANEKGDEKIVKIGFSWPAFFFTEFWAISKRLWPQGLLFLLFDIGSFIVISNEYNYYPIIFLQNVSILIIRLYFGIKGNYWLLSKLREEQYIIKDSTKDRKDLSMPNLYNGSEWVCDKCGASNVEGALVCYSCASSKTQKIIDVYNSRMRNISEKINSIRNLKKMAISLDEKEDSEIIETHNRLLEYLESYYEKYSEICYSNDIEILSKKYLAEYDKDLDLNKLYKNLVDSINQCYEKYMNDSTLTNKEYLEVKRIQYEKEIKSILKNAIIDKTNNVINNISPINDKYDLIKSIKESLSCDVDILKLNEAYEKFESEVSIA